MGPLYEVRVEEDGTGLPNLFRVAVYSVNPAARKLQLVGHVLRRVPYIEAFTAKHAVAVAFRLGAVEAQRKLREAMTDLEVFLEHPDNERMRTGKYPEDQLGKKS